MEEVWKDVVGYEGFAQVSNYGRVSCFYKYKNNIVGYVEHWHILNQNDTNVHLLRDNIDTAYKSVRLNRGSTGTSQKYLVHRLVAQAFIPNPGNKPQVNHIDRNPSNNNVNNLEWVTYKENVDHYYKQYNINMECKMVLIANDVIIDYVTRKGGIETLAKTYKLSTTRIRNILTRNGIKILPYNATSGIRR